MDDIVLAWVLHLWNVDKRQSCCSEMFFKPTSPRLSFRLGFAIKTLWTCSNSSVGFCKRHGFPAPTNGAQGISFTIKLSQSVPTAPGHQERGSSKRGCQGGDVWSLLTPVVQRAHPKGCWGLRSYYASCICTCVIFFFIMRSCLSRKHVQSVALASASRIGYFSNDSNIKNGWEMELFCCVWLTYRYHFLCVFCGCWWILGRKTTWQADAEADAEKPEVGINLMLSFDWQCPIHCGAFWHTNEFTILVKIHSNQRTNGKKARMTPLGTIIQSTKFCVGVRQRFPTIISFLWIQVHLDRPPCNVWLHFIFMVHVYGTFHQSKAQSLSGQTIHLH